VIPATKHALRPLARNPGFTLVALGPYRVIAKSEQRLA
jgi:hypothetical protein